MEAHHSDREQRPSPIVFVPDLEPQLLLLLFAVLHLLPRRHPYLVQFRLEGRFLDRTTAQSSQGQLSTLFPAVGHEPSGALRKEDQRD